MKRILLFFVISISSVLFINSIAFAENWNIESVEIGPYSGSWSSMALDSADNPYMVHYEPDLKLNYKKDNIWQEEILLETRGASCSSIDMDSLDNPHIAYINRTSNQNVNYNRLEYMYRIDSEWYSDSIDADIYDNNYISLAIDKNNSPHIAYMGTDNYLRYAFKDSSSWHIELLNSEKSFNPSLALDSKGNPHIAYNTESQHVKYAKKDSTGWDVGEIIDTSMTSQEGHRSSIAIDEYDNAHVAYYMNTRLKYASKNDLGWITEMVLGEEYATVWEISMELDAEGNPHISHGTRHYDYRGQQAYTFKDSYGWHTGIVDSEVWTDQFSSLELDSDGDPHIAYHRIAYYPERALKYAYQSSQHAVPEPATLALFGIGLSGLALRRKRL